MKKDMDEYKTNRMIPQELLDIAPHDDAESDPKLRLLIDSIAPSIFGVEY